MPFTPEQQDIRFQCLKLADGNTQLAAAYAAFVFGASEVLAAEPEQVVTQEQKPARGAAKAKAEAPGPDLAASQTHSVDAPKEEAKTEAAPTIEYSQVSKAILDLVKAKGRAAALGVLTSFNVDNGSKLTQDQYPEVLAAIEKVLG